MNVGVASTWKPLARRPSASASSALSMTMPSIRPRYSMAIARADTSRPSSRIILAAEPCSARPPMIGLTAITGAPRRRSASRMPGTARIGSIVWYGLQGASTTASRPSACSASSASSESRAASTPPYWKPRTAGSHFRSTK
jgi:hypothetical protein